MTVKSRTAAAVLALAAIGAGVQAQSPTQAPAHVLMAPADMKWGPAPPSLPAGAQAAVLSGDPSKAAPFVISLKFPAGFTVPPHWHPTDENVVVVSGSLMLGMGEKLDVASMKTVAAGGYANLPKQMRHYARANGATQIMVFGTGPFEVNYVNPNDDPRNAATKK
jgi:quercetin dioxygenase-like cupin family protein